MLPLSVLVIFWLSFEGDDASPSYDLRPRSSLCVKNNVSCSVDESCTMFYYPVNSTQCANVSFTTKPKLMRDLTLGTVGLDSYRYEDRTYSQTGFNLSFSNISWTHMKFRFIQHGNNGVNTCRQFKRSEGTWAGSIVYDCIWSDERYEGKSFTFEYEAETLDSVESARVFLSVPVTSPHKSKFTQQILVNVETFSGIFGYTSFHVFWHQMPSEYEVKSYRIMHLMNNSLSGTERTGLVVERDLDHCEAGVCTYTTSFYQGNVRFGVQPIFENGDGGIISKSPYIQLGKTQMSLMLLWLGLGSVCIPALVYCWLRWRQRHARSLADHDPSVLLIHSPSTSPHLHVVEALANYFNAHCHLRAWMDEIDIPHTQSKDPFEWCSQAMQKADIVCVVASPLFGKLRSGTALYHTDKLLLRLLREHFGSRSNKTRFCVVLPPYTTASDLPPETSGFRKFRLPGELDGLLHFMTCSVRCHQATWLPSCLLPASPGGSAQFPRLGAELADCIDTAHTDLTDNMHVYIAQANVTIDADESEPEEARSVSASKEPLLGQEAESTFIETSNESAADLSKLVKAPGLPPFDRRRNKEEDLQKAREVFADYPGNVDLLNLSGEKPVQLTPSPAPPEFSLYLENLNL